MAVKEALLGILTLGPAYGLQLHSELRERAPHRSRTNVGQIYGTLDRLVLAGLVTRFGETTDGLPLYSLTDPGIQSAEDWLTGRDLVVANDWPELLDRILLARSLNDRFLESVIGAYELILSREPSKPTPTGRGQSAMLAAANARFHGAALAWLGDIRRDMSGRYGVSVGVAGGEARSDAVPVTHGYTTERPKRGRPAQPVAEHR
ncbi:MAG: PadR family transcriptional regulator [Actinomycetales bacterium]|nr:PadR family transcriptional regulator [Actinomycetales bacterium]